MDRAPRAPLPADGRTAYAKDNTHGDAECSAKRELVARAVREAAPRAVRDLGCNTGDYAAVALEAGAGQVVGAKADAPTAHLAFVRAQRERPHHRSPHARALLAANARIVGSHAVSASGRVLFVYDRRP